MTITDSDRIAAEALSLSDRDGQPRAIRARYDRSRAQIVIRLDSGLQLMFPPRLAQGLGDATPDQLSRIEISPSGDGLHWPDIDADLFVPGLLQGVFGSRSWMARSLGASGGRSRSEAKALAARGNGLKGGRPKKPVTV